jgi:hypothetical protein
MRIDGISVRKRGNEQGDLVRERGLEPPRPFGHKILSLARLPVPPLPQRGQHIHYTGDVIAVAILCA